MFCQLDPDKINTEGFLLLQSKLVPFDETKHVVNIAPV